MSIDNGFGPTQEELAAQYENDRLYREYIAQQGAQYQSFIPSAEERAAFIQTGQGEPIFGQGVDNGVTGYSSFMYIPVQQIDDQNFKYITVDANSGQIVNIGQTDRGGVEKFMGQLASVLRPATMAIIATGLGEMALGASGILGPGQGMWNSLNTALGGSSATGAAVTAPTSSGVAGSATAVDGLTFPGESVMQGVSYATEGVTTLSPDILSSMAYQQAIQAGASVQAAEMAAQVATNLAGSGMDAASILQSSLETALAGGAEGFALNGQLYTPGGGNLGNLTGIPTSSVSPGPTIPGQAPTYPTGSTQLPGTPGGPELPGSETPPVDPTKVDPTKVDPTKVDPTKVDPTKVVTDLSKIVGGAINIAGALDLMSQMKDMGPQYKAAYDQLANQVQQKYGALGVDLFDKYGALTDQAKAAIGQFEPVDTDTPLGKAHDGTFTFAPQMQGMFDSASEAATKSFGYANAMDMNKAREEEFKLMQALYAPQDAADYAELEARRIAQGVGGLQSFNAAYSQEFTDPNTGQTYTIGADPMMVAMFKGRENRDLQSYLQADNQALQRYQAYINSGIGASQVPLNMNTAALNQMKTGYDMGNMAYQNKLAGVNTWMKPAMEGVNAYGQANMTGIAGWGKLSGQGVQAWQEANNNYVNAIANLYNGAGKAVSSALSSPAAADLFKWGYGMFS